MYQTVTMHQQLVYHGNTNTKQLNNVNFITRLLHSPANCFKTTQNLSFLLKVDFYVSLLL